MNTDSQSNVFTENIISKIEASNDFNPMQKNKIRRSLLECDSERDVISKLDACVSKQVSIIDYTKVCDRFVIVETNDAFAKWHTIDLQSKSTIGQCSHSMDIQMLITLAYKYDGANSQFPYYASKMLSINLEE